MSSKKSLILLISLLIVSSAAAETIIVGSGSESNVYPENNETANITNTIFTEELKKLLLDLQATTEEKKYLEALDERNKQLEEKYTDLVDSLEQTTKKQLRVIEDQNYEISKLQSDLSTSKETMAAQQVALQHDIAKINLFMYVGILVAVVLTVFLMEWVHALTKRKRLFFKLRQKRDAFPINPAVILGDRK